MTDRQLAQQADAAFRNTTITYSAWLKKVKAGAYPALGPPSQWGTGFGLLDQIGRPVTPPTGPVTITTGGTHAVNATTVSVDTTSPVTITGRVEGTGVLFNLRPGAKVVIDKMTAKGAKQRTIVGTDVASLTVMRSSFEGGAGTELEGNLGSLLMDRVRHTKIQRTDQNHFGNFLQCREVQNATVELRWCEVISDYDVSEVEDIISMFKSSNLNLHDCMLWQQSTPGNQGGSSQNAVTFDGDSSGTLRSRNNNVRDTQIVGACGGVYYTQYAEGGLTTGCRVISDGMLPNGQRNANGYSPGAIQSVGSRMVGNTFGYVNRDGNLMPPEIPADQLAANTLLPKSLIDEQAEWARWQTKLAANNIVVGATT